MPTLPKFNSSPLKSYRDPIGKYRLPVPAFFRGFYSLASFQGGFSWPCEILGMFWRVT